MYFALDFGGTNFRISWTSSLDRIVPEKTTIKIRNSGDYLGDSRRIIETMKTKSEKAVGVVAALPGIFDYKRMVIRHSNNLKPWIGKPFILDLESVFDCQIFVEKDAVVAGYGEGVYSRLGPTKFLYLTWGTGIGGCLVTTYPDKAPKVTCLNWKEIFDRLESLCSGGHAKTNFGCELKEFNDDQWTKLGTDFEKEVLKICGKLAVNTVVLGGGVTEKQKEVVALFSKKLTQSGVILVRSSLGDYSAIVGGFELLKIGGEASFLKKKACLLN